jgi:kynurenine formamidase/alkylation response protein AidB-like acyl-CoA dehydrogenase
MMNYFDYNVSHSLTQSATSLLDTAKLYLQKEVAAVANEVDTHPQFLSHALQGLGKLGLLALRLPRRWGGKEASEETFANFQELVARCSGALAFLQTQHQSASGMLLVSHNISLQEKYLPYMSSGEVLIGVGFSQLRREGKPLTVATEVEGGYQLDGFVPWVTGWNIFSKFIVAATLPDGSAVFGIVPFCETSQDLNDLDFKSQDLKRGITFSPTSELVAMSSTNTVSATLTNWFLANEDVVFIKPPVWIHENDKNNVLRASFLATGCALAGLDILETILEKKSLPFIKKAFESLQQELNACRNAIKETKQSPGRDMKEKLRLRSWAIDLATRIAHAAVTVSSGAAIYSSHAAQRVYREALVFTVTAQTPAVMEATLDRLTNSRLHSQMQDSINLLYPHSQAYSRVVDLSHVIDTDIPQWQGDPVVEFEVMSEVEKNGYYLRRFSMGEHSATHINAPKSFDENAVGIDQFSTDSLVVNAVVIDIIRETATNPDYVLTVADVLAWEEEHGKIPAGCVVLLNTGWHQKWSNKKEFMNEDAEGIMHFPGFAREVTQFLLQERQIAGVGIDTHGVDSGQDSTFATNCLVLEKQGIVLENLTNLGQLPATGTTLVIGALKLRGGSGSPVAVLGFTKS